MNLRKANIFLQRLGGCLLTLAAVTAFDYVTGYELSSSPLYLFPVALSFFNFGPVGGYIAGVISAVIWTLVDKWTGHWFSSELLRWETGFSRFLIYALSVWGLSLYRTTVATHRERLEMMRQLIPICHECGRIRVMSGEWKSPEQLLSEAPLEQIECASCRGRADVS